MTIKQPVFYRILFCTAFLFIFCSSYIHAVVAPIIPVVQILLAMLPAIAMAVLGLFVSIFKPSALKKGLKLLWRQKIPIIIIVLGCIGAVYGYRTLFPSRGGPVEKAEETTDTFPMFRSSVHRTGTVGNYPDPNAGGTEWAFAKDFKTFYCSPAVVGNRVYVTSVYVGPYNQNGNGAIYCLDADTGGVVWKCAPKGYRATFSSPAVEGKYLVVGEGLHFCRDARVFCLDLENSGNILWVYRTASHVESSPCIYKDKVYIGAGDDGYYCFKLDPASSEEAQVVWHAEGEKYPDAETPPAVYDGKVYVGLGMGGMAVCCLDAETGEQIWRTNTPYPVFTPPTVVKDTVIVGMGNGTFAETAGKVKEKEIEKMRKAGKSEAEIAEAKKRLNPIGVILCLDSKSGSEIWRYKITRTVLGAVAYRDSMLFFGSRDKHIYCISAQDGRLISKYNTHAAIVTSPAVTEKYVYTVTETGKLYGLSIDGLELVWEATVGTKGLFLSSPTVARGHVYVGSDGEGLLCMGTSEKKKPLWAGTLGGPGNAGSIDGSPLPERGMFSWRYPASGAGSAGSAERIGVTAPAACIEDTVYLPVSSGPQQGIVCLALEKKGEKKVPKEDKEKWIFKTDKGVSSSPATDGEVVIFTDGSRGEDGRFLYAADAEKGTELWKKPISKEASGLFVMTEDAVLAQDKPGMLSAYDHTGKPAWKAETGELAGIPAFTDTMVMTAGPSGLQVMDRLCGAVLWKTETGVSTGPVAGPDLLVYAGTDKGVGAYSLINGDRIWETDTGKPGTVLVLGRNYISYINDKAQLVCLDINSRKEVGRVPGALPGISPIINRGVVLFCRKGEIASADPSTRKVWRWMKTSWLGTVTAPIVQADSRIYFAADKRGFICARKRLR